MKTKVGWVLFQVITFGYNIGCVLNKTGNYIEISNQYLTEHELKIPKHIFQDQIYRATL